MVRSLSSGTYAIVDTETTGVSAARGQIIEIGILRVEGGKLVKTFKSLINPGRLLSHTIAGITGITDAELEAAPYFEDIAEEIYEMLSGAVLVAHNARFDYSFIKAEFARLERKYTAKTLCTVKLSRMAFPGQGAHNLDAVIEAHGLSCISRHRAYDDAEVLWQFFTAAEKSLGEEALTVHINGELSALFLESKLIKELSPVYNRALRRAKELAVISKQHNEVGYATLAVEYTGEIEESDLPNILAVCRSARQAKVFLQKTAKEHKLCAKLLNLEKGGGACFSSQIEICLGACLGKEDAATYNKRFDSAFLRYKIKSWPFGGPVMVKDETEEGDGTAYVIDNWCLEEIIDYTSDSHSRQKVSAMFDFDSYKIFARFLLDPKNARNLAVLNKKAYLAFAN